MLNVILLNAKTRVTEYLYIRVSAQRFNATEASRSQGKIIISSSAPKVVAEVTDRVSLEEAASSEYTICVSLIYFSISCSLDE